MIKSRSPSMKDLEEKAKIIRKHIIDICFAANTGHIAPALSVVDILTTLYFSVLKVNPKNPLDPLRDRFILSKGHAAAALYAILCEAGFFNRKKLFTYCKDESIFGVHPDYNPKLGIELTTGSLGHGLSVGIGMALALRSRSKNTPRVFVLGSDAELNEGSIWEGVSLAGHHKLDNLILIIDDNGLQAFGRTSEVLNLNPLVNKFKNFGWNAVNSDGHNISKLKELFLSLPGRGKPSVVVAKTTGGKGVSFMEDSIDWHYLSLTKKQYKKAREELSA